MASGSPSLERESLPFALKHTNISQPSIVRSQSQHSLAASEDYYSLSSRSSNRSDGLATVPPPPRAAARPDLARLTTPPSHYRAPRGSPPRVSYEGIATPVEVRQLESPPRITPMRGFGKRRDDTGVAGPVEGSRRISPIQRKPVPSTVYEEAPRQSIRYIPAPAESSVMKDFARDPDPPTPEASDAPHILFALDQLSNDLDERGERAPFMTGYFDDEKRDFFDRKDPLRSNPPGARDSSLPPIPPRDSRRSMTHSPDKESPCPPDLLLPFDPASDSFHQPLTAVPAVLQPLRLGLFILLLSLFTICLLFCAIWSRVRTGLTGYGSFGDGVYYLWQYLPTMIGMTLLLWLFEIEKAVYRVAPFIALSSQSPESRSHGVFLSLSPSNFLVPTLSHLRAGQPLITIFLFVSWLSLLTIPLLGSSFNVYYRDGRWMWLATQGVIWTVIALYILLLVAAITLMFYLHRKQTGLKWDACSIADLITVVQASNTLDSYAHYPTITCAEEVRDNIVERQDGLGYFHSSARPNEVVHTIGAPNRPARRAGTEDFRRAERVSTQTSRYSTYLVNPESGRPYSDYSIGTHNTTEPVLPQDLAASWQSHIPWFMRTSLVILWLIAAIVLLLAFLIISYMPTTYVRYGFLPDLSVVQSSFGFSSANFLYSFVPTLLALLCLLVWQPFDLAFRRLQPYASLSTPGGQVAEKTLLLSYSADAPVSVALKAAVNGHIRVAILSLTTLVAAVLPILASGVFWAQFSVSEQRVRIYAHMPAFYALTVFFALYCLSYALTFPGKKMRLPNEGRSLADVITLVHQSKILDDGEFRTPASKIALETRLLSAHGGVDRISHHDPEKRPATQRQGVNQPLGEAGPSGSNVSLADSLRGIGKEAQAESRFSGGVTHGEQPKYGFGRYMGRDGREWLGIDRVGRPGRPGGEMVVRE